MTGEAMPRPSDKWIPWYIVLFFVFLSFVFGGFAYIAQKTHTGVVTEDAYKKGLAYNSVIEKAKQQEMLGYIADISMSPDGVLRFGLMQKNAAAVDIKHVSIWFFRPTQSKADVHGVMTPAAGGGYEIRPALPARGLWEVRILADTAAGPYQAVKRIVIE